MVQMLLNRQERVSNNTYSALLRNRSFLLTERSTTTIQQRHRLTWQYEADKSDIHMIKHSVTTSRDVLFRGTFEQYIVL